MCSAFRTFQGWTALSEMQPDDGVLHVIPIPRAMGLVLLRALQDDIADDDLCGAVNDRVLAAVEQYHDVLLPAYGPIPAVEPGDTVVARRPDPRRRRRQQRRTLGQRDVHPGGAVVRQERRLRPPLRRGVPRRSQPADFAAEDYEVDWTIAGVADLDEVGRRQLRER